MVRLSYISSYLYMTIAVDWDVKHQTNKQVSMRGNRPVTIFKLHCFMSPGVDKGFLEKGFIYIKCGGSLC